MLPCATPGEDYLLRSPFSSRSLFNLISHFLSTVPFAIVSYSIRSLFYGLPNLHLPVVCVILHTLNALLQRHN
jgi:hypothetical protein